MTGVTKAPVEPSTNGTVRRWNPFAMLADWETELDRFFADRWPFAPLAMRQPRQSRPATVWTPRVDVFEQGGQLVVKAELPGVTKSDVTVTVDRGDLVIRGERQSDEQVDEKNYYRTERFVGRFARRLPLPEGITPDQIHASFADGVLTVTVPLPAGTTEPVSSTIPIS